MATEARLLTAPARFTRGEDLVANVTPGPDCATSRRRIGRTLIRFSSHGMVDGMTSRPGPKTETLILRRNDIAALLDMQDCIDAVERAFLDHAAGTAIPPAVVGTHIDG